MKTRGSGCAGPRMVAVLLAVVLGTAVAGAAAEPGHGGPAEGIKVHGHWTIEIRNPDGSLDSRHDLENALMGGQSLLAGLLSNYYADPTWFVIVWGVNGAGGPCRVSATQPSSPCILTEPRYPGSGPQYFKNLVVNVPIDHTTNPFHPVPAGTVELSGSATVEHDDRIDLITSTWRVESKNHGWTFTSKTLSPGIPVRAGQAIQVKVVFSFS